VIADGGRVGTLLEPCLPLKAAPDLLMTPADTRPTIDILLVEDNPGDVRLTREALQEGQLKKNVHVASNGNQALHFLRRQNGYAHAPRPDLILLDLNLPGKNGLEVLSEIKAAPDLRRIPTIVLTASTRDLDIFGAYDRGANCMIVKPIYLDQYSAVVKSIEDFWLTTALLPYG
jgi:two-component system, chemotaxis family, response regulator Rcp1